ncbi:hypothetical protein BGX34_006783 [Mortierella sp. NVP85]|nr:hypothetical protein BGX34_006783 [Mortierella sp. NVP85]
MSAMFNGDSDYQSVIDKINKVNSHGLMHKLSIPQLAIVGDQSSGKSSVLEALTQLSFPRDKGMCTRFATQVNLRRNPALQEDVLSAKIEGENEFNKRHEAAKPAVFHAVIKEAVAILCQTSDISDKVLELTLSGPNQSPLTVIDLPGFINTTLDGQEKSLPETIRAINRRYIQEPRTIIIAVVQANVDLNTSRALCEAAEHDPEGLRTIPIVTKPDRIEPGQVQDWVEVVLNRSKTMKRGYLVMRNAGVGQEGLSWEESRVEEDKFFGSGLWNAVPTDRKGRVAVRKFLGTLLFEHISKELPGLKREIDAALDAYKKDLKGMGTPIATTDEARERLSDAILDMQPRVISFLNADYDRDYVPAFKNMEIPSSGLDPFFVRSSLLRQYHEYRLVMEKEYNRIPRSKIVLQIARYKGNDLPGFVSFTTFKNIVNGHYLDGWEKITRTHVREMHKHLTEAISGFLSHTADATTRDVFTHVFDRFSRQQFQKIEETIKDIYEDESTPFTLSRVYQETREKVIKERPKTTITTSRHDTPVIDTSRVSIDSPPLSSFGTPQPSQNGWPESPQPTQQQMVDANDENTANEFIPCLTAYLTTARERIVDKVLMETLERHMIKRIKEYFVMLSKLGNTELQCMLESPTLKRKRHDLETKIDDFDHILNDL